MLQGEYYSILVAQLEANFSGPQEKLCTLGEDVFTDSRAVSRFQH